MQIMTAIAYIPRAALLAVWTILELLGSAVAAHPVLAALGAAWAAWMTIAAVVLGRAADREMPPQD